MNRVERRRLLREETDSFLKGEENRKMKEIEADICPDAEEFYLALKTGWGKMLGHRIEIGDFQFSAVPIKDYFRISELRSGAKMMDIQVPESVDSYEETMLFLEIVAVSKIVMAIEKIGLDVVKREISRMEKLSIEKFGPRPKGKKVNTDWIKADVSDVLN